MSHSNKRIRKVKPRRSRRGFLAKGSREQAREGWLRPFWARYGLVVRSCSLFFATIGLFIFLYSRLIESRFFGSFLAFNARITAALLDFTGRDVTVKDNVVSSPRFAFQIVDLCTAIMPMMILTAAVLAFPSRVKEKGVGLLLGLLGLFVVNQIRLVSLFYVGIYVPSIFGATHLLIWQALMIVLAIGLWLVWAYRYVRTASS